MATLKSLELSALEIVALNRAIGAKCKGKVIEPGSYYVDREFKVHVTGTVNKGEDVEYTPTADIPMKATLALVLKKAGIQRKNIRRILTESMQEAITMGKKGSDVISEQISDIEECEAYVKEITDALPKKTKTGPTTGKLTVNFS